MYCIVLCKAHKNLKNFGSLQSFRPPPSTLWAFPFGPRPAKMWWIPNTHIFLTKFLPLQKKTMAKSNTSGGSRKISFGKKSTGKHKKSYGPKDQKPKKYRGQGR